jgi:hypothetical protein
MGDITSILLRKKMKLCGEESKLPQATQLERDRWEI